MSRRSGCFEAIAGALSYARVRRAGAPELGVDCGQVRAIVRVEIVPLCDSGRISIDIPLLNFWSLQGFVSYIRSIAEFAVMEDQERWERVLSPYRFWDA